MNIGDYVRTKYYGISKILNISNETTSNYCSLKLDRIDDFGSLGVYVSRENIIKSSPNIIDLIEVGDYVNGYKVLFIDNDLSKTKNIKCIDNEEERQCFYGQDIKSIVTKEQFESIKYEVN